MATGGEELGRRGRTGTPRESEAFPCQIYLCLKPERQTACHQLLAVFVRPVVQADAVLRNYVGSCQRRVLRPSAHKEFLHSCAGHP